MISFQYNQANINESQLININIPPMGIVFDKI